MTENTVDLENRDSLNVRAALSSFKSHTIHFPYHDIIDSICKFDALVYHFEKNIVNCMKESDCMKACSDVHVFKLTRYQRTMTQS